MFAAGHGQLISQKYLKSQLVALRGRQFEALLTSYGSVPEHEELQHQTKDIYGDMGTTVEAALQHAIYKVDNIRQAVSGLFFPGRKLARS